MRKFLALSFVTMAALGIALPAALAQGDPDRVIPGGGIFVQGWTGKIDASSVGQGRVLNDFMSPPGLPRRSGTPQTRRAATTR